MLATDAKALFYQVPGGMLSNLLSQLKQAGKEDKLTEVLEEVPRVRKDAGYPPLVTPTSQIVGTQAVFNVITGERYKMCTKESKALVRGEYGQSVKPVDPEVKKKVIGDEKQIFSFSPISAKTTDSLLIQCLHRHLPDYVQYKQVSRIKCITEVFKPLLMVSQFSIV